MSKQEELFNQFSTLGKSFQNLGRILQNPGAVVTWEEVDQFDRDLEMTIRQMQQLRMPVILHLKDEGLIQ